MDKTKIRHTLQRKHHIILPLTPPYFFFLLRAEFLLVLPLRYPIFLLDQAQMWLKVNNTESCWPLLAPLCFSWNNILNVLR